MPVLTFQQLQEITGYKRAGDVERCLKRQGVRYLYGKDGVWTTLEAVNEACGVKPAGDSQPDLYSPDLAA